MADRFVRRASPVALGPDRHWRDRDCPVPKDSRYSLDIAALAIFLEYVEFDGDDVLKLVVQGEAGRTIK